MSFDIVQRTCPLPVFRAEYDDDGDEIRVVGGTCDEVLFVDHEERRYLYVDGEADGCGPTWKVVCGNGHVLLVPEHEDDNFDRIPYDEVRVAAVLDLLGTGTKTLA